VRLWQAGCTRHKDDQANNTVYPEPKRLKWRPWCAMCILRCRYTRESRTQLENAIWNAMHAPQRQGHRQGLQGSRASPSMLFMALLGTGCTRRTPRTTPCPTRRLLPLPRYVSATPQTQQLSAAAAVGQTRMYVAMHAWRCWLCCEMSDMIIVLLCGM
jgi:hypothetical protein